ncbi:phosphoribosyl-AMP cyclohydrolase [Salinisphaera sp. USBA-960]|uniref:phosphoribosyl-AMP cyclohydrolase n=1 Tax=Salinisphaera orenii TaxID=856731 RepID=UPI000DBEA889|nr:phosphoribosyl-AMP cyclohydrolase [Salifodinibacter halophilus]NNC25491.1 phosphoribosyl-AMP cyclohydrolase [Salifodinibacter halophilus]
MAETDENENAWLESVAWSDDGLVPTVTQSAATGRVLMLAYMDREALAATRDSGFATYYSRSKGRLWVKGESSGATQQVRSIHLDCDGDTILLMVDQRGGVACHTGRQSCFYRAYDEGEWRETDTVQVAPETLYKSP